MAIKGKSKSRGARSVTRGPKPAFVPVRTPMLRRRGLWIGVGAVLVAGLVAVTVVAIVRQRTQAREDDERERIAAAVDAYRREVDPILLTVGQSVPPTGFNGYQNLATALAGLEAEDVSEEALELATTEGEAVATSAQGAGALFQEIDTAGILQGQELPREFVLSIVNSQEGFRRAMNLYREAALLVTMAVEAEEGETRTDLVARARGVSEVAAEQLTRAYADYVEAQVAAGLFENVGGLPTFATGPTG